MRSFGFLSNVTFLASMIMIGSFVCIHLLSYKQIFQNGEGGKKYKLVTEN